VWEWLAGAAKAATGAPISAINLAVLVYFGTSGWFAINSRLDAIQDHQVQNKALIEKLVNESKERDTAVDTRFSFYDQSLTAIKVSLARVEANLSWLVTPPNTSPRHPQ
jgi:hypothetical protein